MIYRYGSDGQRALKSTGSVETAYFSKLWTWTYNKSAYGNGARTGKHIYLNSDRLVTKLNNAENPTESEGGANLYYYHSDHLGSAQMVTDYRGQEYERLEYTPWGEVWIDKAKASNSYDTPYRFTGKERDTETGLYYYGARYYDAKYSRWLSCDPALGEYMTGSKAGGGIYNSLNFNLYNYSNNNPITYVDPDGRDVKGVLRGAFHVTLSCLTIAGGVSLMAASGISEVGSVGTATPAAVAGAAGGYALVVSGLGAFACSAAEMSVEIADCFTENAPEGDVIPTGIGGCVGAGVDSANGFNAQKEGVKGQNQIKGEAIETLVTTSISTYAYGKSIAETSKLVNPDAKQVGDVISNEVSHQYDMYSAAGAIGDLSNKKQER